MFFDLNLRPGGEAPALSILNPASIADAPSGLRRSAAGLGNLRAPGDAESQPDNRLAKHHLSLMTNSGLYRIEHASWLGFIRF
jgi:hypothetical protein